MWLPLNLPLQFPATSISSVFPCIRSAINYPPMAQRNIRSSTLGFSNHVYLWLIHLPLFWAWRNILVAPWTVWALSLNWKPTAVDLSYMWCFQNAKAQQEKTFMNWTLSMQNKNLIWIWKWFHLIWKYIFLFFMQLQGKCLKMKYCQRHLEGRLNALIFCLASHLTVNLHQTTNCMSLWVIITLSSLSKSSSSPSSKSSTACWWA